MALDTDIIEHQLLLTVVGKESYMIDGREIHEVEFKLGFGEDERSFYLDVTPQLFQAYVLNTRIRQTFYSYGNGPLALTKKDAMATSIRPVFQTVKEGFY